MQTLRERRDFSALNWASRVGGLHFNQQRLPIKYFWLRINNVRACSASDNSSRGGEICIKPWRKVCRCSYNKVLWLTVKCPTLKTFFYTHTQGCLSNCFYYQSYPLVYSGFCLLVVLSWYSLDVLSLVVVHLFLQLFIHLFLTTFLVNVFLDLSCLFKDVNVLCCFSSILKHCSMSEYLCVISSLSSIFCIFPSRI